VNVIYISCERRGRPLELSAFVRCFDVVENFQIHDRRECDGRLVHSNTNFITFTNLVMPDPKRVLPRAYVTVSVQNSPSVGTFQYKIVRREGYFKYKVVSQ
jgi:hypothetical protein